ncbi:MAG TPA: 4Fe-4S dicluster domain-containing protein [Anaerolineae bacterium]|nr:4Fe-4S dicluster domain-containing protein [Anaerolineae bacterium]
MLTLIEKILFSLLVVISLVAALNTWGQMARIIERGQGKLYTDHLLRRLWEGFLALFTQGSILRRRKVTSLFHFGVAWGFIFYGLVNAIEVAEAMITGFEFLPDSVPGNLYRLAADLFSVAVLVGIFYFLIRRFAFKDKALTFRDNVKLDEKAKDGIATDSLIVIVFIGLHIGFRVIATSALVAEAGGDPWQPFANWIAQTFLSGASPALLTTLWHVGWWIAIGLVVLFIPYFPYTKHLHLITGPLNYMTSPERTYIGQLKTLDFEDESIEQFGANNIFDLDKTQLVDTYACIMCNRCQDACPAYFTGKELSPAALEVNKRYYVKEMMYGQIDKDEQPIPLMEFAISESAVWACTACGACIEACPVDNTPMLDIMDIRRDRVLMESDFPQELKGAFVGMERMGNPWQSTESRMAWTEPLDFKVPTVEENPDFEYLLWVGCAGAFNPDSQEVTRALATILHEAGINFAVLGEAETCTGDSARRAGNEYLYYEMALGNIETLNAAGVDKKRIVTSCPHCFTTIGKEYGELGGHYDIFHHTQLIADLVGKGKLQLNSKLLEKTTFHDPCYLGRMNGVIEAPRQALTQTGAALVEMPQHGKKSFCCGAGGAQYWKEEEHGTQAVSLARFEEAAATGAETLAVGCPFCNTMMGDANREKGEPMQVKDVAQIVLEAMKQDVIG